MLTETKMESGLSLVNQFNKMVHTFNWHTPSWDLFILLAWIVASVMYAFAAGRGRILTVLMSVYMAKLIVLEAPFLASQVGHRLGGSVASFQQLITFLALFLVLFMFLGRYVFKTSTDSRQISGLAFSAVFGFLQIGLLINSILVFLPTTMKTSFAPLIQFLFIKDPASFVWLVAPVIFLIILGRTVSERLEA